MRGIAHKKEKPLLFIMTSHDRLGDTREKTGFRFEELAIPYYLLHDAGLFVDLASIAGGPPHPDPHTYDKDHKEANPDLVSRFTNDPEAMYKLLNTLTIGSGECRAENFRGLYLVGGYGAMWDFPENEELQRLVRDAFELGLPVAALGHGAAGLLNVKSGDAYVLDGREITATSNDDEYKSGRRGSVPFLLENRLRSRGARFRSGEVPFVVEDHPFITGQNLAAVRLLGEKLRDRVRTLAEKRVA